VVWIPGEESECRGEFGDGARDGVGYVGCRADIGDLGSSMSAERGGEDLLL
jgi:hypothetical protein